MAAQYQFRMRGQAEAREAAVVRPARIGDVVTTGEGEAPCTVEFIQRRGQEITLTTARFDKTGALQIGRQRGRVTITLLDAAPETGASESAAVGGLVRLRSGGPVMDVRERLDRNGASYVQCGWIGPDGVRRARFFDTAVLRQTDVFEPMYFGPDE